MAEIIKKLISHKANNDRENFNQFLNEFMPSLKSYVAIRLHYYEAKHILPNNFYCVDDIIADIYIKVYENIDDFKDANYLKVDLYRLADDILASYLEKENKLPKSKKVSIRDIIDDELNLIREKLAVNAEGERVLLSDLTFEDISYEQKTFKPKIFLFDADTQKDFARSLDIPESAVNEKTSEVLGSIYDQLPEKTRRILDLRAIGGLTYIEISEIVGVDTKLVESVLFTIKQIII